MIDLKLTIILISVIILHEFGHWIALRLCGFKPNIKVHWFGFTIGDNCYYKLKPISAYIIHLSGIAFGFIPLIIGKITLNYYLVYLITCSIDITNMVNLLSIKKHQINMTLREIVIEETELLKKEA